MRSHRAHVQLEHVVPRRGVSSSLRTRTRCYKSCRVLILAFDTATDVATSALVADGEVLGERMSRASTLLEDVDALLRQGSSRPEMSRRSWSGQGRGASRARGSASRWRAGLALALGIEGAGVSTLDALAAADENAP